MSYTTKLNKLQQEFFNYFSRLRIFLKEKTFLLFLSPNYGKEKRKLDDKRHEKDI
jgi:hypothetical protein